MRVQRLIELLQDCDPDAFVTIGVPNCRREYVEKLTETPACLLYFRIEERTECSYSRHPNLPPLREVLISASLDSTFYEAGPNDPENGDDAGNLVEPDFRPEAN